ncbi:cytidine deaminase [Oceanibacterium hippocampi]|uniref:Cytidine deaminase n=1 Tax=Oceanibacterium hippocampi TaxID=745714 RepID=A0A1Y5T9W2_9PROT|nr:cytidine deaminase [Oceanibacterium hippocampi]SLN58942.1 Cytidine deaminase [Oceanibacterium hippocampi]
MNVILPALELPAARVETPHGAMVVPGRALPARSVDIDASLVARLIGAARSAAGCAHVPYSNFHVGAALVMADDPQARVFTGANIENASYGATNCGERSAIFAAAAAGFRRIRYLAVSTVDSLGQPIEQRSPCGICRQVIGEFAMHADPGNPGSPGDPDALAASGDETLVFIDSGAEGVLCEILDMERLLPFSFRLG